MYISIPEYGETWRRLVKESISHSTCRVVIFVSCLDVDALCAAKIMARLLQKDLIPHKIIPVVGYHDLKIAYQSLDEEIKNVICIGAGATVDLGEELEMDENDTKSVHIIDNHRPWHLNNLFGNDNIVCYDDGAIDDLDEYRIAYEFLAQIEESNSSDSDSADSDVDDLGPDNESALKRNMIDSSDEETGNTRELRGRNKRRRTMRASCAETLLKYHAMGTYFYSSNSVQVYSLVSSIGETSLQNLWLTVVGVTSLEPRSPEIYTSLYPVLKDEITRLGPQGMRKPSQSLLEPTLNVEKDYSFFLLRQWSLYDSMIHSSYLSAKLYLWTEEGKTNLNKLLARMGISLEEARERWTFLSPELKDSLQHKLESISDMYGIQSVIRDGIVRKFGFKGALTAGDCAEALASLLEAGTRSLGSSEQSALPNKPQAFAESKLSSQAAENVEQELSGLDKKRQFWVENFWVAWDSCESHEKLLDGIMRAKILQQAVVATGAAIFEKGQLKDLHVYRLAVVRDSPDIDIFRNPLSLARLGIWVADGCAEIHAEPMPLVIAVLDEGRDKYLILGMGVRRSREESNFSTIHNHLGNLFQKIAEKIHAKVTCDAFESSVIEIARDDLTRFLETLTKESRKS